MIRIEKAILHILDFSSGSAAYSDALLPETTGCYEFLEKHMDKACKSQSAKPGRFVEGSRFAAWLDSLSEGELDFIAFSKEAGKALEDALLHADVAGTLDLIFVEAWIEEKKTLAIIKCTNHMGYTHQITTGESGVQTDIVNTASVLPAPSQRVEEFALIDMETRDILVQGKRYALDGDACYILPEILLEATLAPSPQETLKSLSKTAEQVADAYGVDKIQVESAVKNFISENMEEGDVIDVLEAGKEIFKENPSMQADFDEAIRESGFEEPVRVDPEATMKKVSRHKLKTDTGIELTIPTDYMGSTEYVEFVTNEDGTLSITLKHISNIINR